MRKLSKWDKIKFKNFNDKKFSKFRSLMAEFLDKLNVLEIKQDSFLFRTIWQDVLNEFSPKQNKQQSESFCLVFDILSKHVELFLLLFKIQMMRNRKGKKQNSPKNPERIPRVLVLIH